MKIKFIALISLIAVSLSFISCSKDEDRVSSDNSGVMLDSLFYSTIQEAIDEAEDGDTIYLTEGIYADKGDKNLRWNGDQKHLTITLHPNAEYAIIHCNGDGSGFKFGHTHRNTSDVIDGITIQNAGGYDDAGIYCDGASPLIKNCKISGCGYAGVFCDYAGPQIENTIITENKNGIIAYDYSSPLIQWCTIQGNSMDGVYITENASSIINNSLIVENKRGGIYCNNSSFQGINNTIANNVEWGIYEAKGTTSNLMNSIIWGNEVGFKPETANLLIKYSCAQDSISAINPDSLGNIYEDPRFIFPDDYHLHQGSPCINAGDNEPVTWEVDIEGNPRIMFDIVDMGAYEWQGKSR